LGSPLFFLIRQPGTGNRLNILRVALRRWIITRQSGNGRERAFPWGHSPARACADRPSGGVPAVAFVRAVPSSAPAGGVLPCASRWPVHELIARRCRTAMPEPGE